MLIKNHLLLFFDSVSPFPSIRYSLLFFFPLKPEFWNIYGRLLTSLRIFQQSLGFILKEI